MALDNLGNGAGYLYITDSNTNVLQTLPNNKVGARAVLFEALTASPLSGETLATGTLDVVSVAGTGSVTSITVNSVQILSATVTGTTVALLNANLVANIVAYAITSGYTAYLSNGIIYIQAAVGTGSTPNGYVVVVTNTSSVITSTNMAGGSITSGTYSTGFNGRRFYLWADSVNATPGGNSSGLIQTGASEISSLIIQRGNQTGNLISSASLTANSNGQLPVTRASNFQIVVADTHSSAGSGTMTSISTAGFVDGDMLQIRGYSASDVITITSGSGAGLVLLTNGVQWISGNETFNILVEYSATLGQWIEVDRSPALSFATASVRSQGIPWAVPGSATTVLTAGGGTINLTAGVSAGIQYITTNGSPLTLTGSWVIQGAGSPMDGDVFWIIFRLFPTTPGVNTITAFGQSLTTLQVENGNVCVKATFIESVGNWDTLLLDDFSDQDYATVGQVNAKENLLGDPAVSGYVLSSTTGGVRSWVPNGGGSGSTGITIANRVYVNKSGNDGTGLVQRFDLPFLTIAAARAAANAFWTGGTAPSATNRILIDVATGYYTEGIILDNYIDYALSDSIIERQSGNFGTIDDNNVSCNSIVSGNATLRRTGTGSPGVAIQTTNSGTVLTCSFITASSGIGYVVSITNGTVSLNGLINSGAGGITATAGKVSLSGSITITGTNDCILNSGATVTLNGNAINSGSANVLECTGGTINMTGNITMTGSAIFGIESYTAGTVNFNGNINNSASSGGCSLATAAGGTINMVGNVFDSVAQDVLNLAGGTINMTGNITATASGSSGVCVSDASAPNSVFNYYGGVMTAQNACVILQVATSSYKINNARMVCTGSNKTCVSIVAAATLILNNCTLIATGSGNSVSGSANNVLVYGACQANKAIATVTLIPTGYIFNVQSTVV